MAICKGLCHIFSSENMRFVVDFDTFLYKIAQEDLLHKRFVTEFYFFFYFTFKYVLWMNKLLFTGNNFLLHLVKKESCSSPHCIFSKCSCLECVHYKSPAKECYQSIKLPY